MNQSVIKALSLLNLFSEETPELSLKEISVRASIPKPTAYRLLTTLERMDYLYKIKENEHDSRYRLGLKLLELGHMVSNQLEVREVALPYMRQLGKEINEAIHLVIINHDEAIYIEKVESTKAVRLFTRIGKSSPLHIGSGPKLLLAYLPLERQKRIMELILKSDQQLNKDKIWRDLNLIRKRGYAFSEGEQDKDTTGLSFPIFNYRNQVIAALTVSGLTSYFKGVHLERLVTLSRQTAIDISNQLGYREQQLTEY
ncbi:IclR family transcriptional regulator [Ornithinibacillus gellani]|uniref:IclR family transcriptional regulator n=1 Tax=Ornithinibacillus gellani TaxID=2293253 RepID=UPI000F460E23|nr:IclR family transcriptional regulator [Ornithinibacillus gellani]TQS70605.1 IclR family transcriptional regulator [Ornithinibacillus gellani]